MQVGHAKRNVFYQIDETLVLEVRLLLVEMVEQTPLLQIPL